MIPKYHEGEYVAIHENPAWKDKANFIIRVFIGTEGGKHEWEQLWVSQITTFSFLVCCIPFFTYGISIGDEVETDEDYSFMFVSKASGNFTYRVWFIGHDNEHVKRNILLKMAEYDAIAEWSSKNLLALSVSNLEASQKVFNYLAISEQAGYINFERGELM